MPTPQELEAKFWKAPDKDRTVMLGLDAEEAQIWLNENSLFAGVRMLPGIDPSKDHEDKVSTVELD